MTTKAMKEGLARAKKLFGKAQENLKAGGGGSDIDDGRYKARIISAEGPVESKSSSKIQAIIRFKILDGEFKDTEVAKFSNLEHEVGQSILMRELGILGYEVEDFDDYEATLEAIDKDKPSVRIRVSTKNEFQNISIDKLLEEEEEGEPEEPEEPEAETVPEDVEPEPEEDPEEDPEVEPEPEEAPEVEPEAEEEEGGIELEEGSEVAFTSKGKKLHGPILEIVDEETVRVKANDKKTYKLNVSKLEVYEAPKAPAKKPAAKKVKKVVKRK